MIIKKQFFNLRSVHAGAYTVKGQKGQIYIRGALKKINFNFRIINFLTPRREDPKVGKPLALAPTVRTNHNNRLRYGIQVRLRT